MMQGTVRLSGDVGGKHYKVETQNGRVTKVWVSVVEECSQRGPVRYEMPVWPRTRKGRTGAGRRLRPVLAEAEHALAKLAAARSPPIALAEPVGPPVWTGRMTGL
jgi:hypothetical protein